MEIDKKYTQDVHVIYLQYPAGKDPVSFTTKPEQIPALALSKSTETSLIKDTASDISMSVSSKSFNINKVNNTEYLLTDESIQIKPI